MQNSCQQEVSLRQARLRASRSPASFSRRRRAGSVTANTGAGGRAGYGPLVNKGDLWLPAEFRYQIISRQERYATASRRPASSTAWPRTRARGTTVLIRNHENRARAGEQTVIDAASPRVRPGRRSAETRNSSCDARPRSRTATATRSSRPSPSSVARPRTAPAAKTPWDPGSPARRSSNAARTAMPHGYIFEIDARADGPCPGRSHYRTPAASRTRRASSRRHPLP